MEFACKLCDPTDFKAARCSKFETGKQSMYSKYKRSLRDD